MSCINTKKKKRITCLEDGAGKLLSDEASLEGTIINYFTIIFKSEVNLVDVNWSHMLDTLPNPLNPINLGNMSSDYTEDEIQTAVFQLNPSKALGKDGFSALFYQNFWNDIKRQVIEEALKFLNGGDLNAYHNITQIILIPKTKNLTRITYFRPISLCSVFMKIISRVLVNRIQPLMD